jgi:NTE family protein
LTAEHIMASSAIPVAFPPVRLSDAEGASGDWYLDGGVRLNAPVKPALDLGADRLVVVATHPLTQPADTSQLDPRELDLFGAFASVLTATLVDRMVEDVRALDRVNRLVAAGAQGTGYREVPYLFAGPPGNDTIPALAEAALHANRGLEALLNPELALLDRLIGGTHSTHGELLSYLLFDPDFIDALIDRGRRDGEQLQATRADPWQLTQA